jgi:hypothetical protein
MAGSKKTNPIEINAVETLPMELDIFSGDLSFCLSGSRATVNYFSSPRNHSLTDLAMCFYGFREKHGSA